MNTLIFLAGVGVGTLVSSLIFIGFLVVAVKDNRSAKEKAIDHQKRTEDLLEQRNKIDAKIEQHLAVLAHWCDVNWTR